MSVFRLFSFSNCLVNCRGLLSSRNVVKSCDEQRASITYRAMEKLGVPVPPKRPMTPYLRFAQLARPKIVSNEPNLSPHDVVKKIAQQWHQCDAEEKKMLQKEYLTEMQSYLVSYENYKKSITPEQEKLISNANKKKKRAKAMAQMQEKRESLGRPKKPPTAFIKFMLEKKANRDESVKYSEWLSGIGKQWEHLPENEKQKYQRAAEAELQQYKTDVLAWEEQMLRQGHIDVVRNKEHLDKTSKKKSNTS